MSRISSATDTPHFTLTACDNLIPDVDAIARQREQALHELETVILTRSGREKR
jgi:hypothetical protein